MVISFKKSYWLNEALLLCRQPFTTCSSYTRNIRYYYGDTLVEPNCAVSDISLLRMFPSYSSMFLLMSSMVCMRFWLAPKESRTAKSAVGAGHTKPLSKQHSNRCPSSMDLLLRPTKTILPQDHLLKLWQTKNSKMFTVWSDRYSHNLSPKHG